MQPIDLLIVCVLVISGLTVFLYRRLKASALHNKLNSAGRSKLKTLELLEERGYKIVDCDRSIEVCSIIDGKTYSDILIADFEVQKGHLRYLVKIAGGQSSRLGYRENRENLIGISAVFRYPNLLLVDPERKNIRLMKTAFKEPFHNKINRLKKPLFFFILGSLCTIIAGYRFL
jgi:hypothetical protein